jgi:hypothetical protein
MVHRTDVLGSGLNPRRMAEPMANPEQDQNSYHDQSALQDGFAFMHH